MAKSITLRLPVDLDNGNATNWLCKLEESGDGITRHVRRAGRPDGWVDTVFPSFMTLPEVRTSLEARGYEVTFNDG